MRSVIHIVFFFAFVALVVYANDRIIEMPVSRGGDFLDLVNSDFWVLEIDKHGNFYLQDDDVAGRKTPLQNEHDCSPQQMAALFPKRAPVLIIADKRLPYHVIGKVFTAMRLVSRYKINLVVNADFSHHAV